MEKGLPRWQMAGFIFTAVMGTLLHFLFDWTGGSVIAALFSAVNESIWEHMKLFFYPAVAFAWIEYFFWGKSDPRFWWVKLMGILTGLLLIPALYYTYTGIFGVNADWFNVTIFFLSAMAAFRLESHLLRQKRCLLPPWAAVAILCLLSVIFTLLTFLPPQLPLFRDPLTGTYGYL